MSERLAIMLDRNNQPVKNLRGEVVAALMPQNSLGVALRKDAALRKQGHVSGNQIDIFHCPFCGSGAVVARSDMSVECSFCSTAFTVTVSPLYPAFPMSVNGQPYPWPGRPDGGVDPSMMGGDPNATVDDGSGYGGQLIPGGGAGAAPDDADGDGDGNPFADGGPGADDEGAAPSGGDDEDTEAEVGGKKKPPFTKKKSSRMYRTASGAVVSETEFLRHLAIKTARDPNAMAARIKQERRA